MTLKGEIIQWLQEFEKCVRSKDYKRGERMFHTNSYCFGSKATMLSNREELIENQWKKIWRNITDFRYDLKSLQILSSDDSSMTCAICRWHSIGYHKNGDSFSRPGRATFVFQKSSEDKWLAIHSHYSLVPKTPNETVQQNR